MSGWDFADANIFQGVCLGGIEVESACDTRDQRMDHTTGETVDLLYGIKFKEPFKNVIHSESIG